MFLMYIWRLNEVGKNEDFFENTFSSKMNPNGREAKEDFLDHPWRACFSNFSIITILTDLHTLGCFSIVPSASSSCF